MDFFLNEQRKLRTEFTNYNTIVFYRQANVALNLQPKQSEVNDGTSKDEPSKQSETKNEEAPNREENMRKNDDDSESNTISSLLQSEVETKKIESKDSNLGRERSEDEPMETKQSIASSSGQGFRLGSTKDELKMEIDTEKSSEPYANIEEDDEDPGEIHIVSVNSNNSYE